MSEQPEMVPLHRGNKCRCMLGPQLNPPFRDPQCAAYADGYAAGRTSMQPELERSYEQGRRLLEGAAGCVAAGHIQGALIPKDVWPDVRKDMIGSAKRAQMEADCAVVHMLSTGIPCTRDRAVRAMRAAFEQTQGGVAEDGKP